MGFHSTIQLITLFTPFVPVSTVQIICLCFFLFCFFYININNMLSMPDLRGLAFTCWVTMKFMTISHIRKWKNIDNGSGWTDMPSLLHFLMWFGHCVFSDIVTHHLHMQPWNYWWNNLPVFQHMTVLQVRCCVILQQTVNLKRKYDLMPIVIKLELICMVVSSVWV